MININEKLIGVKTVAITGHIRPDGDCVGSTLGFYNYIKDNFPEISADVYLEKPGHEFAYLRYFEQIQTKIREKSKRYDLLFVFDCGDEGRFEPFVELISMADRVICIDHHMSNSGFADENYVIPDISATCELLYECLTDSMISKETAECLYTGIICDTGIFRYPAVTSRTMQIAGNLMNKGINHNKIIDDAFFTKTYRQNQLMGRALLESELILDGKCIYSAVSKETMDFYGLFPKEMGGVIDQLRNTEGVEVAIFLYELHEGEYKASIRSREYIDVSRLCQKFGGGGHVRASGCTIKGEVADIIKRISEELIIQFREHGVN